MPKSADAFRTISEVAEVLDTPAHVLRFWESRFTQVKPVKRAGGRRYYRPADVELLAGIKKLLHEDGLTIRGVQKILKEDGVRHVAALAGPVTLGGEEAAAESTEASPASVETAPTPHWPEAPAPEPEAAEPEAAFPQDPDDTAPETPYSAPEAAPTVVPLAASGTSRKPKDPWNQPSLFDEPVPEAPMAEDVEPEEPELSEPRGEVVSLMVGREPEPEPEPTTTAAATAAQDSPESDVVALDHVARALRAVAPDALSSEQIGVLANARTRLAALRAQLGQAPRPRGE